MKTSTSLLVLLAAAVAIATPVQAFAASEPDEPDPSRDFAINGAGATFPYPLIDLWRVEYNKLYPNVSLNYQAIGSGGGVSQHENNTVNFAASDAPLTRSEMERVPGSLQIPESLGGVAVAYNIPEVPDKGLKITGSALADIYLGKITRWNDPQIAQPNPGLDLPDAEIVVASRADGSGTTFVFTDYLSAVSQEWFDVVGKGKSVPWPTGLGGKGNFGVAEIVRSTPYAIGYVELAYVFQANMSYAYVQNAEGTAFIEPTLETISEASDGVASSLPAADGDWSQVTLVNAPGQNSYPIASFTYLLLYEDMSGSTASVEEAKALVHMVYWMITDGQMHSESLLYVPLSDSVAEIGKQGLAKVRYGDQVLFDYDGPQDAGQQAGYAIPGWIKDNARWWADGLISDEEYVNALQYLVSQGILKI